MQQRMERFFPWLATALLAGVPSVWLLWLAGQGLRSLHLATGLTVFFALTLALALCCVWLPRRHLPPPAPAFVPDPLYLPGSFALSTAQFFPVSDSYREDPPAPPKTPHTRTARMAATAGLVLAVLACMIPLLGVVLGLIALPCCISARKKEGCRRRALAGILFAGTSLLQHVLLLMMLYVI